MIPPMDMRTAIEVCTSVGSAVAVVATLKTDIRWMKRWMSEHKQDDDACFHDVRGQLTELRTSFLNHRSESLK